MVKIRFFKKFLHFGKLFTLTSLERRFLPKTPSSSCFGHLLSKRPKHEEDFFQILCASHKVRLLFNFNDLFNSIFFNPQAKGQLISE